jgi:hypothetical protein
MDRGPGLRRRKRGCNQVQALTRENTELAARLARASDDLTRLGALLQERSTEAVDAARRVTELETEMARLRMDRALQAGRSPFSPNVSFDAGGPSATPHANTSLLQVRRAAAVGPSPLALSEQLRAATTAAAGSPRSVHDSTPTPPVLLPADAVVPSLDTSQLSVAAMLPDTDADGERPLLDVSMDEEWRMGDHAYLSLHDRTRKLEAVRDSLDQRYRKGTVACRPVGTCRGRGEKRFTLGTRARAQQAATGDAGRRPAAAGGKHRYNHGRTGSKHAPRRRRAHPPGAASRRFVGARSGTAARQPSADDGRDMGVLSVHRAPGTRRHARRTGRPRGDAPAGHASNQAGAHRRGGEESAVRLRWRPSVCGSSYWRRPPRRGRAGCRPSWPTNAPRPRGSQPSTVRPPSPTPTRALLRTNHDACVVGM